MKNKVQFHQFDPAIYPFKLWIAATDNQAVINERFKAYPKGKIKFDTKKFGAGEILVIEKETKNIGVLLLFQNKRYMSAQVIAHESSHAAKEIWNHLEERYPADEANAYLIGWFVKCAWQVKTNKFDE